MQKTESHENWGGSAVDGAGVKPVNKQQGQLALLSMEKCKRWGPQGTGLGWFYFVISDLEGEGSREHEGNSTRLRESSCARTVGAQCDSALDLEREE